MILGINASGRNAVRDEQGRLLCGATEELVKYLLEKTGEPTEYVSLSGKRISGCMGCVSCAGDNICVIEDDWAEIRDRMFEADAVVFGAPNYYGTINAMGHAFLERTFSLRHRERFPLSGKLNAIISVGTGEPGPVEEYVLKMFRSNYMAEPMGIVRSTGLSQCYRCGYGESCAAGAAVGKHGFLERIESYHLPELPESSYLQAHKVAHRLGEIVRSRR
ncbi:MAG: flavodoxin family protein [Candidatus Bathyarchaeota archaeon]